MSYTPGPWDAELGPNQYHGSILADVGGKPRFIARFETNIGAIGEGESNARLAAAAPDLYEALRELYDDWNGPTTPALVKARAALLKAEPQP